MTKAVFTHKAQSGYLDLPEVRYHFPRTYLRQVEAALGDLIVYYEPGRTEPGEQRRVGRKAYVATARVVNIEADSITPDHYFAYLDDYLPFNRAVPFREADGSYERVLDKGEGSVNKGAFGRAVRLLAEAEYEAIVAAGFADQIGEVVWAKPGAYLVEMGLAESPALAFGRPIVERLTSRPFRDAAFARAVREAYDDTCVFTGIKLVNGGGRTEVQAAHIRPVHDQGPDSVRNGLALSGTVHWMFDRGLISVAPDHTILTASKGLPEPVLRLFNPDRRIRSATSPMLQPAPAFLEYHRQAVFKG